MSKKQERTKSARQVLDTEAQNRNLMRHLDALERDNYQSFPELDMTVGGVAKRAIEEGTRKARKKSIGNRDIRRLFAKKNLALLIEESKIDLYPSGTPSYLTITAAPSVYPPRKFCSVCGFQSAYNCIRCGMKYCSLKCLETHQETRCMKFIS